MQKQLDEVIEKFKNSKTSLEAYGAISDFVKLIKTVPEFIKEVEKEGEQIRLAKIELSADKGHHLGWRDKKRHNEIRGQKYEILCQLDSLFPLSELETIHEWLQSENMTYTALLFEGFKPDDALPESERNRNQGFMDKLYKKIVLFLEKEVTKEKTISTKDIEIFEKPVFDSENSILHFLGQEIKIAKQDRKTNAHLIMDYIFIDNADDIEQEFSYSFIALDKFGDEDYKSKETAWTIAHTACKDIQEKIRKGTKEKIEDFLIFNTGISGSVKINKKYLNQAEKSIKENL